MSANIILVSIPAVSARAAIMDTLLPLCPTLAIDLILSDAKFDDTIPGNTHVALASLPTGQLQGASVALPFSSVSQWC